MILLTQEAAAEFKRVIESDPNITGEAYLRVMVSGGGCAGFEYQLGIEQNWDGSDQSELCESEGVQILIDPLSFDFVKGSTIDYSGGLNGKGFAVQNPNAASNCGCGKSFSPREEEYDEEGRPIPSGCNGC